jgi:hypothetical protein
MWETISQYFGASIGAVGGPGVGRDLPELWIFPGFLRQPMAAWCADIGDPEAERIALAIVAQALRDARGHAIDGNARFTRAHAIEWLRSGEAVIWLTLAGKTRIRQADLSAWLDSGCEAGRRGSGNVR